VNLCSGCGEDFGSVSAFDAHRTGRFDVTFPENLEEGRRCLDTEELAAKGWRQDKHGRWRTPAEAARPLPLIYASRDEARTGRVRFAGTSNRPRQKKNKGQP
jgi:hypothetical protein